MGNLVKAMLAGQYVDPFEVQLQTNQKNLTDALKYGSIRAPRIYNHGSDTINYRELEENPKLQTMRDAAFGLSGGIVWHGSPYKFSKFDMSKIGTGEGAQAYGHGLYFADAPETAKSYAEHLADWRTPKRQLVNKGGKAIGDLKTAKNKAYAIGENYLHGTSGDYKTAIAELDDLAEMAGRGGPYSEAHRALQRMEGAGIKSINPNENLYKVELPDDAISKMLDWDKPLSAQGPKVSTALREMVNELKTSGADMNQTRNLERAVSPYSVDEMLDYYAKRFNWKRHGNQLINNKGATIPSESVAAQFKMNAGKENYRDMGHLYRDLSNAANSDYWVSQQLHNRGIPGIKYLDQRSRGAGKGSRNYVVFDDSLVRILERNGIPVE